MKVLFRSFYNIDFWHLSLHSMLAELRMLAELHIVCTNCKHMLFKAGNSDSKKLVDRKIYCSKYPGSQIPITSSQDCIFFKLQLKYKLL